MAKRIELRNEPNGELDEVVIRNAEMVHFERMSDTSVICIIDAGNKTVRVHIGAKNNRSHLAYFAEID